MRWVVLILIAAAACGGDAPRTEAPADGGAFVESVEIEVVGPDPTDGL